jgi:hypothetical protein
VRLVVAHREAREEVDRRLGFGALEFAVDGFLGAPPTLD